jgi:ankyrin repeat protein
MFKMYVMIVFSLLNESELIHWQHRGNTALHFASAYGYSSLAKWLIEKGADDSIMNFSGLTCYDGVG